MIYPLKTIVLKLLTVRLPQTSPFTHSSHNMITGMKSVLTFDSRHQNWHCCLNVRDMKIIQQQKCGQNVMKTHETPGQTKIYHVEKVETQKVSHPQTLLLKILKWLV